MLRTIGWIAITGALLLLAWLARWLAERREAMRPPPGEWVEVDGRRLHLRRAGSGGPTIVFEAGGAFSSAMWWPLQDRLAALASVVCYDRAGLGWSEPAELPRSIGQRADELGEVLRTAQLPAPYRAGRSLLRRTIDSRIRGTSSRTGCRPCIRGCGTPRRCFASPGARTYLKRSVGMLRAIAALAALGLPRLLRMRGTSQPATALPFTQAQRAALRITISHRRILSYRGR